MSLWNKSDKKPSPVARGSSINVIATKEGWVYRQEYKDVNQDERQKDQILVAIRNLSELGSMGNPDISELYVANSTGGSTLKNNDVNYVYVVYTEPFTFGTNNSAYRLTIANTIGGNSATATSNTSKSSIVNANNTLVFKFTPNRTGTYKIQSQSLANSAVTNVYSLNSGPSEKVNTVISSTVSNTLSTFTIS